MAKTNNKVQMPSDIRNRLMAAVAMLMIACIMLVTTTYAWFTLSTAPEVTNIDTQVAGNGSLEIALMPADGDMTKIKAGKGTSSSVQAVNLANRTWGNLVSLSSTEYGLANVKLMPAKIASGDSLTKTNILNTAEYGRDGRITTVSGVTSLASYVADAGTFSGTEYGVRAIGEANTGVNLDTFSTFGYVVDLALRTNTTATDGTSPINLMLQTAGIQRIYNGSDGNTASTDTATQGAGTTFTVTGTPNVDLLKAIRFTFIENMGNKEDTAAINVLGTARLSDTATNGAYSLVLFTETTDDQGQKTITDATPVNGNYQLTTLEENVAKQISVVVWLDGSKVDSADFAIEGTSLNGVLNLQFSTDTTLYPASNTTLKNTATN